ncbi:hypothetical protein HZS_3064 [Henneguya salminicola]|nr:hypothetical protein HZS_3064 [Henneguya salminicola]
MNDNYLQISNLTNCNKYTAIVKIPGLNIGRILQFTYKSSLTKSPKILQYDYSQSLLYWSYNLKYCISNIFYIECLNRDRIVLQNFSTHNYILIPNNLKLACHVSACPFNVFNLSCSSFSSTIYIEYYSPTIIILGPDIAINYGVHPLFCAKKTKIVIDVYLQLYFFLI